MKRRYINTKSIFLIGLVSLISVGYAYLTSNLNIKGTASIGNAKWDIHFTSVTKEGNASGSTAYNPTSPVAEFGIVFNDPQDTYSIIMDVKNFGGIDAELKSISSKIKIDNGDEVDLTSSTLPNYLKYSVVYLDEMQPGDRLNVGDTKRIKINIGLKDGMTYDEFLNLFGKKISFKYEIKYVQADVGA